MNLLEICITSGLATAVATGISTYLNGKKMAEWKKQADNELEKLRHKLETDRLLLNSAITNLSSGQMLSVDKKIKAIQDYWKNIIKIREYFFPVIAFYSVLHPSEYNDFPENEKILSGFDRDKIDKAFEDTKDWERDRPFLGEKFYTLFFCYRAFLGRLGLKVLDGKEGRNTIQY